MISGRVLIRMNFPYFLLALVLITIFWSETKEYIVKIRRRFRQNELLKGLHERWLDRAMRFTAWRSENRHKDEEHPHYQWHLRNEANAFKRYLDLKRQTGYASYRETRYLEELEDQIDYRVEAEKPPKETSWND